MKRAPWMTSFLYKQVVNSTSEYFKEFSKRVSLFFELQTKTQRFKTTDT